MPIIVPIEENKVGLATATDAKFRAPDYSGSGLDALGTGLAQLGGGAQQLASGIEERRRRAAEAIAAAMLDDRHQSNIDDAAVKKAYVDYSDLTHEALHGDKGLFKQQGADAHAAFSGVVEQLVDNHDKALSKLDEIQRSAVAPSMNERLRSDVGRAADFVRQQGGAEQKWQSEQLKRAAARDAANHADDPELFDHHLATGENTIRQQAKIDNVGEKLLAKQIADYKSAAHADTIDALAQRDPVHAAGWYARYGHNLNQRDKMRAEAGLGPSLADARAAADVDAAGSAGDPTAAPATPHAGNDATLLLKMQGITPMMDHTALPSLMQRYGNDPAKAWAAFEAGPETIDRLIAQRGDDWYAGLGDDTRRFVGGNMRMLDAPKSSRDLSVNSQLIGAGIAAQPWENSDISARRRDLAQRVAPGISGGPSSPVHAPTPGSYGSFQPAAYWQPDLADLGLDIQRALVSEIESDPSIGAATPATAQRQGQTAANTTAARPTGKSQPIVPQATVARNRAQAEIDIQDPYFRALMTLIGRYEGPDNPNFGNGYYTITGHFKKGDGLQDLSEFPSDLGNTAVGRYQIQRDGLWGYASPPLGIKSFTPHDQDMMAAYAIRKQGIYTLLRAGDYERAAAKISPTWAAFPMKGKPGGYYGQAHKSYEEFVRDFATELANAQAQPKSMNNPYLQEADNPYLRKMPMRLLEYYVPPKSGS